MALSPTQIAGGMLLAAPFVGLFLLLWRLDSFKAAATVMLGGAALCGWIFLGIWVFKQ